MVRGRAPSRVREGTHQPDRRQWLKAGVATGAGSLLAACGGSAPRAKPRRVAIVGGGLTGLALLDALIEEGIDAWLFEAAPRLGGRIHTLRGGGWPEGLHAEAGAERLPRAHRRLRRLVDRLGLRTREYAPADLVTFRRDGRLLRWRPGEALPESWLAGLSEVERAHAPLRVHCAIAGAAPDAADDPRDGLAFLRAHGLTPAGERLVRAFCTWPLERMSAASLQNVARRELIALDSGWIEGGCDRITEGLAARHRARIFTGLPVEEVLTAGDHVRLRLAEEAAASPESERAAGQEFRAVVLTATPRALERIALPPALAAALRAATRPLAAESERKIHWSVPLGRIGEMGRYGFSDAFPRGRWVTPPQAEGLALAHAMAFGPETERLRRAEADGPEGLELLLRESAPEAVPARTVVRSVPLDADPLLACTWMHPVPGQRFGESFPRAGRVAIATPDLGPLSGWMEGALVVAERARGWASGTLARS